MYNLNHTYTKNLLYNYVVTLSRIRYMKISYHNIMDICTRSFPASNKLTRLAPVSDARRISAPPACSSCAGGDETDSENRQPGLLNAVSCSYCDMMG